MSKKQINSSLDMTPKTAEFEVKPQTSILAKISFAAGLLLLPITLALYFYFYYDLPNLFETLIEIGLFLWMAIVPTAFFFGILAVIRILFSSDTRTGYGLALIGIAFSVSSVFAVLIFFSNNFTMPT